MKRTTITPVLSLITAGMYASAGFSSEFNTAFLQGTADVPTILKNDTRYPAGTYYIDVSLNGTKIGRMPLIVSPDDEVAGQLCLSPEWLKDAGIFFKLEEYQNTFDSARGCYLLGRKKNTQLNFDLSSQTLDFVIPQAWMADKNDATRWDYGINGFRMTYNGNFNKNIQSHNSEHNDETLNSYGGINTSLNLGRWILSTDMNMSRNAWRNEFDTNNLVLSTAISQIRGDLLIGRSQTRTELFRDFGFYGAALRSNNNMRPWNSRGYAPVVAGVAQSTSRLTISQGGYTIYSRVVPPGPYRLDDIMPVSNGNLVITLEDNNGQKTITEYPVATMSSLLRPGEFNYNFAVGERSDSNEVRDAFRSDAGVFTLASLDYGLPTTTLNSGLILHNRYQAFGFGVTQPLGEWGVFSASLNASKASYDKESDRKGVSATFKYAKNFTSRTDLQLLTYRYQSPGYIEFSDWNPGPRRHRASYRYDEEGRDYRYLMFDGREKSRYEALLSHRFDNLNLSASYWQQSYWDRNRQAAGASVSASTSVGNGISVFLSGNYARNAWGGKDDLSGAVSINIPFSISGTTYYSSNSISSSRNGATAFNNSTSATVNERFNYSVNAGTDSRQNNTAGASGSYAFDRIQTNMAVSKNKEITTLSGSASGSVIATAESGLLLTKEAADTVAIVKLKDTPGVSFNNSLPTNSQGNTVLYLTGYNPTSISINPENVPDNAELLDTSFDVVPTEKAIIYREFGFRNVLRYIVRLRDRDGLTLTGGNAKTEQDVDAGFISNNGVLLMNLLAAPQKITVTRSNGTVCSFSGSHLKENTGKVQEIRCE